MCGILCLVQFGGKPIDVKMANECLAKLEPRGPDRQNYVATKVNDTCEIFMGFTRLAIMDTTDAGLQPFTDDSGNMVICNGEIYNYITLAKVNEISMKSSCDCEVILPTYKRIGFQRMVSSALDAEFAMVLYDKISGVIYAARDRYGVRPLFYGYNTKTKMYGFASEMKALHSIMEFVEPVKPWQMISIDLEKLPSFSPTSIDTGFKITDYFDYNSIVPTIYPTDMDEIHERINHVFTEAVRKRLHADRPIGFLLSGGLDSSLVTAIATRILGPENIVCFSIGLEGSSDVEAAKKVVQYLGIKQHHIVPFTVEDGIAAIPDVIKCLETYDITTIRASTPQYIMARYIKENTDVRCLFSGEGSDEHSAGYFFYRFAPNKFELYRERLKLLKELYMFDCLRTDRTMSGNGLEVRVPFLDFDYVDLITKIDPSFFMYHDDYIEKAIIRDSFKGYLPDEILYRPKSAFSDAVSSKEVNWYRSIQAKVEEIISDEELANNPFYVNTPKIKEALFYRRIFNEIYPGRDNVLEHYWLPSWCKTNDPSATVLM